MIKCGIIGCGVIGAAAAYELSRRKLRVLVLERENDVAAGTTKAINLATNVAALAVFLASGTVLIPLGLAAAAFNIAGNWLGSTFFDKKGALILRPIMLVVIVLFAIRLVTDLLA